MKKNLAKRIVLGLLTGAVLMSSSVAWAEDYLNVIGNHGNTHGSFSIGNGAVPGCNFGVAIGTNSNVGGNSNQGMGSVAIGARAQVSEAGTRSVALGVGSLAKIADVVSVGYGGTSGGTKIITIADGYELSVPYTRSIINVTDVIHAAYGSSTEKKFADLYSDETKKGDYGSYVVNLNTLCDALASVQATNDATYVKIKNDGTDDGKVVISEDKGAQVTFEDNKVIFGKNSSWYEANEGFFAGGDANHNPDTAKAALKEDGSLMGASGKFIVDGATGNVTAQDVTAAKFVTSSGINIATELDKKADKATTLAGYGITDAYTKGEVNTELGKKADQSALTQEVADRQAADQNLQSQIDQIGSGAISGINQRLEKTNAKINKVGAGAAALAALHPLDYDPDDKLTFSAGMGNYAGENAAALGAFYRPNEKFMLSLGGTMGNGENMVNLGLSIGLDKASGFAKMSKRELIQEVNAVKAENEAMKDQLANADERIAKLEALVAQLVAK